MILKLQNWQITETSNQDSGTSIPLAIGSAFAAFILIVAVVIFIIKKIINKQTKTEDNSTNKELNKDNKNDEYNKKITLPFFNFEDLKRIDKLNSLKIEKQIAYLFDSQKFFKENLNNLWVKKYYEIIKRFKLEKSPVSKFNKLKINKYYKNYLNEVGQWNYCRHHIDEIKISGAIYSAHPQTKEYYKTGDVILVTYEQHLFLHYLIVMAKTTMPNHGMIVGLKFHFNDAKKCIEYWDKVIQKMCEKYLVKYDKNWSENLT